jgi:hypothetical protein
MVKVKKVVSVLRDVKIGNQEVTPQAIWPTAKSYETGWTKGTNCYSWSFRLLSNTWQKASVCSLGIPVHAS